MAVNHADGTLFGSILMYPIAASYAAFGAGAQWKTPLFFVAGLAIGVFLVITSRFLLYSVMERVFTSRMLQSENRWLEWIVGGPFMLVYIAYPIAITCAGLYMTYHGSIWVVDILASP